MYVRLLPCVFLCNVQIIRTAGSLSPSVQPSEVYTPLSLLFFCMGRPYECPRGHYGSRHTFASDVGTQLPSAEPASCLYGGPPMKVITDGWGVSAPEGEGRESLFF